MAAVSAKWAVPNEICHVTLTVQRQPANRLTIDSDARVTKEKIDQQEGVWRRGFRKVISRSLCYATGVCASTWTNKLPEKESFEGKYASFKNIKFPRRNYQNGRYITQVTGYGSQVTGLVTPRSGICLYKQMANYRSVKLYEATSR